MANSNKPYRVLVSEKYESNGEEKWYNTQVGVAFKRDQDDGFILQIRQGISISGRVAILPPREEQQSTGESQAPAVADEYNF